MSISPTAHVYSELPTMLARKIRLREGQKKNDSSLTFQSSFTTPYCCAPPLALRSYCIRFKTLKKPKLDQPSNNSQRLKYHTSHCTSRSLSSPPALLDYSHHLSRNKEAMQLDSSQSRQRGCGTTFLWMSEYLRLCLSLN